jgi:hypothetical protein
LNIKPVSSIGLETATEIDEMFEMLQSEYTAAQNSGATQEELGQLVRSMYQYGESVNPSFDGTNCVIARTEMPIPRAVRANFKELITFVGAVDGFERIPLVDVNRIQYLPYDKYTKDVKKAFFIEDYLYVFNPGGMELINVR